MKKLAKVTVRVPDELKQRMDDMEEVNWSAVVRKALENKIAFWEKSLGLVPPESESEEV